MKRKIIILATTILFLLLSFFYFSNKYEYRIGIETNIFLYIKVDRKEKSFNIANYSEYFINKIYYDNLQNVPNIDFYIGGLR